MLRTVSLLLGLIRFSHTIFALPFALLASLMAWWAGTHESPPDPFRWQELVGILVCMVLARSTAMAVNRLADRQFDAANPRTASRHLPAGLLSVPMVTAFALACGVLFVTATLLFLPNRLPLNLSVPVLLFLVGYSYAKRYTSLVHGWLGVSLMLAPIAAWIAIRGEIVLADPMDLAAPLLLGLAVLTWVTGFDIIYACQDADFDRQAGLHSIPARYGVASALRIAAGLHLATVVFLGCVPLVFPAFGIAYGLAVAVIAVLLVYEHSLVRPDDLGRVNIAFFNVNAAISLGLLLVGAADLYLFG
jgi:4-hydroxybenzoate polyprenyltransferase